MIRTLISILLIGAALGVAVGVSLGWQGKLSRKPPMELFPDMDRQAKLRPQEPNRFYANGTSSQLPPAGTIARGQPTKTVSGEVYAFEDAPLNTGRAVGSTNYVAENPLPLNEALLRRGRVQYDIYCTPCHGRLADGNGITKKLNVMPAVANLHDKRIVLMTDGELFHIITHGKSTMAPLAPLLDAPDRWAVVAYLRVLQLSQLGAKDELPRATK